MYATTLQYRSAICGNPNKAVVVKNCKVGGAIGVVKGGDGEDRYDATILHPLTNVEGGWQWKDSILNDVRQDE